ncbi:MAG: hypothetical protein PUA86_00810 [Clostridiaceae bacterium]|nr:hypothetical protein [Clostridiaceae bacterium]
MYRYRSILYLLCCCLLAGFLCGCAQILEREFVTEEEHISTDDEDEQNTEVLELTSYDELQEALLAFIENHAFAQTVRLMDYTGNVESDVQQVVRDAMMTPLGAFAVTNIAYQSSRILSYYEIRFDITYRRTAQEIEEIAQIADVRELQYFIREKMLSFSDGIIFKLEDYTEEQYDFETLFINLYYAEPTLAYGLKSLEVHFYPEYGMERIVELNVTYAQQSATLAAKSATATDEAQIILNAYIGSQLTANRLKYLYDTICSSVEYDVKTEQMLQESEKDVAKTDSFTVYGALIKKKAVSEGFALAFKQLCDMEDIDCVIVSGKLDGASHMWNLVLNRGEWCHVDCSVDAGAERSYAVFGRTDEEMMEHYTWDRSLYPESSSTILRDMLSLTENGGETIPSVSEYTTQPETEDAAVQSVETVDADDIIPGEQEPDAEPLPEEGDAAPDGAESGD